MRASSVLGRTGADIAPLFLDNRWSTRRVAAELYPQAPSVHRRKKSFERTLRPLVFCRFHHGFGLAKSIPRLYMSFHYLGALGLAASHAPDCCLKTGFLFLFKTGFQCLDGVFKPGLIRWLQEPIRSRSSSRCVPKWLKLFGRPVARRS